MAPVVWLGRDGNEIETVVAVLMSRRHQTAERIRASVGDGGIDIQVPNECGWDIYQVKGFTTSLTSSQKTHIQKSFDRMRTYTKSAGITVTSWNLVTPLDPTKENRKWLTGITKGAEFPCHWPGKIFVDGLAAEFPDVIEYYFGDGKDRAFDIMERILATTDLVKRARSSTAAAPLQPVEAEDGLIGLFKALNAFDPHFVYEFAVTTQMPPLLPHPKLLLQVSKGTEGTASASGAYLTFYVFPKHPPVVDLPESSMKLLVQVQRGSEHHHSVEEFFSTADRYRCP